jgi:hypothetical protein
MSAQGLPTPSVHDIVTELVPGAKLPALLTSSLADPVAALTCTVLEPLGVNDSASPLAAMASTTTSPLLLAKVTAAAVVVPLLAEKVPKGAD